MKSGSPFRSAWRTARWREVLILAAFAVPWVATIAALALPTSGMNAAVATAAVLLLATAGIGIVQWRRRDASWLVREMNRRRPDMEDSADLLFDDAARTPLQKLQHQRLQHRLAANAPDLRRPWPGRALATSLLAAGLVNAGALLWQAPAVTPRPEPTATSASAVAGDTSIRLDAQRLDVSPPAYTQSRAHSQEALSVKAPSGSRLDWRLRFAPSPAHAALVFLDGRRIELTPDGADWTATLSLDAAALYRIEADAKPVHLGKPYRIDAIADQPPRIKVLAPERSLSLVAAGQRDWNVAFEAWDDYGVAPEARLRITQTQGTGENIGVHARTLTLRGEGDARRRRFSHRLDLAALGLQAGDDLIVQLVVLDNHAPQAQRTQSPSLILRLADASDSSSRAVEGVVQRVLPAYFRSQRQIIIDAEALLPQQRILNADVFQDRSDALGSDQRILRLRYGQFLGEEADGAPPAPPHTDSADADADEADAEHAGHKHDAPSDGGFGQVENVLEDFGHTHDTAEAATLLDPQTRAILKRALDQMWQSELHLRQGEPDRALPFAYRALEFIKQVQQADRIYLARVGPDLPPIDESRRLGGKRDGLASRPDALQQASTDDAAVTALWQALAPVPPDVHQPLDLTDFEHWLSAHPDVPADGMALQLAMDTLRQQPDCNDCRTELRNLLWPLLERPAAAVARRPALDAQAGRYLDALDVDDAP